LNLELSERQLILKEAARDFFQKECPLSVVRDYREKGTLDRQLWLKLAELGWLGLAVPEKYGGQGSSFLDLSVTLLEEAGRALLPLPIVETLSGAISLIETGSPDAGAQLLPQIIAGKALVVLALNDEWGDFDSRSAGLRATLAGSAYVLHGARSLVPFAADADLWITVARTHNGTTEDGITVFVVDSHSPGSSIDSHRSVTGRSLHKIIFDGTRVGLDGVLGETGKGWQVIARAACFDAAGRCSMAVGSARRMLELTLEMAKTRVQFGQLIGSFQAIQHQCADMLITVDGMRYATYQAAGFLGRDQPCEKQISIARVCCSESYKQVAASAVRIHGAVGFTRDHEVGLHFLSAQDQELPLAHGDFYRRTIARELLSSR